MILIQSYEAPRDLLTGQVYKRGGTGVAGRLYTYNALGIPTTRRTARQGTVRHDTFGYNERSELTSAALGSAPYAYDYDNDADGCKASWTNTKCSLAGRAAEAQPMGRRRVNIGNRKTAQEDAEAITYAANDLNQYTDITTGETSFIPEYDLDGNQTRIKTSTGIWAAEYNAQNRPVRFTRENADGTRTVITSAYDYLGRRAWKKVETIATDPETGEETATVTLHQRYIYRGYLQVAACDLTRGGHPCLWLITWDPTQPMATRPLAIQKDGTWYCYGWDLTKTICEVFGQAGYIRTTYSYAPYGSAMEEGDVAQPLQWSSEYADPELGLVYYNYRYYNPTDGRWIRRDRYSDSWKTPEYLYANNRPTSEFDRLGLFIDAIGDVYNTINQSFNKISDYAINDIKRRFKKFDKYAKLKARFSTQWSKKILGIKFIEVKLTGGFYVSSDACCVTVSGGLQINASAKGFGLITLAGGVVIGGKIGYKFCWQNNDIHWSGSMQGGGWIGLRIGLDVRIADAYIEGGISASYKYDFATEKGAWGIGVYGRAVFKTEWTTLQYKVTYGNSEIDFD